ncbi:hypothetical protein, partial [Bacteroides pyogenes]|uniref:hypothetical protein n=1 Tax=Bacteroides pyogenes TaxID=310300 RepID=UPI001BAB582B
MREEKTTWWLAAKRCDLVGIGKTATLEKEYKQLAQEYDHLKKAFKPTVIKEVEKQTAYSGGYPFSISGDIRSLPSWYSVSLV